MDLLCSIKYFNRASLHPTTTRVTSASGVIHEETPSGNRIIGTTWSYHCSPVTGSKQFGFVEDVSRNESIHNVTIYPISYIDQVVKENLLFTPPALVTAEWESNCTSDVHSHSNGGDAVRDSRKLDLYIGGSDAAESFEVGAHKI